MPARTASISFILSHDVGSESPKISQNYVVASLSNIGGSRPAKHGKRDMNMILMLLLK
ncbi:MAG: hypothetical protein KAR08_01250 [Candidatus Heimdallarchaeota archaeon]|nr:hypothetical protein [Candidatus Heimdallarchaeota archaeon]